MCFFLLKPKFTFYQEISFQKFDMESLVEQTDPKTGRTVYQYIDHAGKKGRIISKKQHLLDLRQQGKLVDFKIEEICFSSKRNRQDLDACC